MASHHHHHGHHPAAASSSNSNNNVIVATTGGLSNREAEFILPPPSALNPVPALSAALRIDNEEQLLHLLKTDPNNNSIANSNSNDPQMMTTIAASHSGLSTDSQTANTANNMRQVLVFGSESLRTLVMRQILVDPHDTKKKSSSSTTSGAASNKKKNKKENWDARYQFPIPSRCGINVVATRVLTTTTPIQRQEASTTAIAGGDNNRAKAAAKEHEESWNALLEDKLIDVVTYFLRPSDLQQTHMAASRIRAWKKNYRTHHRLVYLPQPTAMIQKVVANLGLAVIPNVSIHRLQLDVFPLETDVFSLEYDDALRESDVEGSPSSLITTVARSLLKLEDVVGKIPRIQSFGPLGEEVVRKLLAMSVDEYAIATQQQQDQPNEDELVLSSKSSGESGGGGGTTTTTTPSGGSGITNVVEQGDVSALIVIDRKVDMVTPMVTPLTYEGLLDDLVGIDCGFLNVNVDIINPPEDNEEAVGENASSGGGSPDKKKKAAHDNNKIVSLAVNGSDSLYAEVRDQHVEKFGSFLQNQAIAMQQSHANFKREGKKKDLAEIHQFVKQIPIFTQNLRTLTNHIHLAELVKQSSEEATFRERWQLERSIVEGEICYDALEDLVASQYPPDRFLRLLCLQSLCSGGIKSSRYDTFRRDVVQTYGYEYLFVLNHLEKVGLLRRREGLWMDTASPFNTLRKSLILINADVDTVDPNDAAYVSSGYAPLTVRLIQATIKGWKMGQREDILKELPGRFVNILQRHPPEDLSTTLKHTPFHTILDPVLVGTEGSATTPGGGGMSTSSNRKPVLMVMYVGGITYMELAALRFLSKRPKFPFHVIIVTTRIINGSSLLGSLS